MLEDRTSDQGGGGERVTVYDWLRFIATIFVVIGHSAYLQISTTYGGVMYELPENLNDMYNFAFFSWCRSLVEWVYGFHMPLFFMLSGAVLALRPIASFDKVFRAKVKRLLVPYFVYGWLFMLPVKRLGNFYSNESLKEALRGFLSGEDSGHLWFLTALFWCIMVFILYKKLLEKWNIKSIYVVLLVGGIIQLTKSYLLIDVMGLKKGLDYIFYFALGYVFECERSSQKRWNLKKTIFAYGVLLFLEIINRRYGLLNAFFLIIAGSFMTYLLSDICDILFKNAQEKIGWKIIIRNLFYVYLFHDPMEYLVLRVFMGRGWLSSGFGCGAYTFCRTVLIFCVSVLLGELVALIKKVLKKILDDKKVEIV